MIWIAIVAVVLIGIACVTFEALGRPDPDDQHWPYR